MYLQPTKHSYPRKLYLCPTLYCTHVNWRRDLNVCQRLVDAAAGPPAPQAFLQEALVLGRRMAVS